MEKDTSNRILNDKDFREKIMEEALADAENKAKSVAMNGSWSDGGAGEIRRSVEDWKCGLEGILPPSLEKYCEKVLLDEDPEYAEFLRLSKKFKKVKKIKS